MPTLIAVIKDLWDFCFKRQQVISEFDQVNELDQIINPIKNPEDFSVSNTVEKMVQTPIPQDISSLTSVDSYVNTSFANVFQRPVWSFDGVMFKLPYSSSLQVIDYEGRFARVLINEKYGFVLKDDLTTVRSDIFPVFNNNEIYSSNHPDTKRIRKIIKDEFFASELYLPLQAVEFVIFRLLENGRTIDWSDLRPRLAGSWQNLLKGRLGVQISILPKTGSIIEYTKPDGSGFVGYTKSVHVDESIVVEGVGRLIEGEYKEEAISKREWQEWRPVWIQIQ